MKAAALETCAVRETETADNQGIPLWLQDRELMDFLTIPQPSRLCCEVVAVQAAIPTG